MDPDTLYGVYIFVIIGIISYFALRYITSQFFNNEMMSMSDVDTHAKQRARIKDVSTDRLDQHTTSDDETEDEVGESDDDEEENRVFQTFVDEANLMQYTDELGVLPGLMKFICKNIQIWKTRKLKIAIIGNSGTGKSSLINAIRGLHPEDEGAAPVAVTETTMEQQEYVLPSNENISFWDLPGVGTQNFKKKEYLNSVTLKEFDAFMIVSASRFSENDVWLANEILKHGSYIFFLRTKIDADLVNEARDHPRSYDEASCLEEIRMDIVSNLTKSKFPQNKIGIYLVSSRESSEYDFPKLLSKLNRILSKKRFALRRILENHLKGILEKKTEQKKGQFFLQKVLLFCGFLNLDSCMQKMYENCKIAFSLDDSTIENISDEIGMSMNHIKTKELEYFKYVKEEAERNNFVRFRNPAIKWIFGYDIFTERLNIVCNMLARDEARLIHLRLNYLEEQLRPF